MALYVARGGVGCEKAGGGEAGRAACMRAALRVAYRAFLEELQQEAKPALCCLLFDLLRSHQRREAEQLALMSGITPAVQARAATRGLALGWLKEWRGSSRGCVNEVKRSE